MLLILIQVPGHFLHPPPSRTLLLAEAFFLWLEQQKPDATKCGDTRARVRGASRAGVLWCPRSSLQLH